MADSTVGSLIDVTSASIGSVAITGIQSINWDEPMALIPSPPADGEKYGGTPHLGSCPGLTGMITFSNPYTANSAGSLAGTLQATGTKLGGQTGKVLQITLCQLGEPGTTLGQNVAGSAQIPFVAGSEDGTTSPVSWT